MSRMKLILTQEVGGLGAPGDVVDVAAGYGRNYLLPRGFAISWTRGGEKQVDLIKRARAAREIRTLEDAQAVAGQLQRLTVRLKRRAGSNGRLFGSVGATDIAEAVRTRAARSSTAEDLRARPDQGGGHVQGPGPAAPRGDRLGGHRSHRRLVSTACGCFFHSAFHRQSFSTGNVAVSTVASRRRPSGRGSAARWSCVPLRAPGELGVEIADHLPESGYPRGQLRVARLAARIAR